MPLPSLPPTPPATSSPVTPSPSVPPAAALFPLDLHGNPLDDILTELDKSYATTEYSAMTTLLHEVGLYDAKDLIARDIADLFLWTAIPIDRLSILHERAIHRVAIDHLGGQYPPQPEPNDNDSSSDVQSEVVDSCSSSGTDSSVD